MFFCVAGTLLQRKNQAALSFLKNSPFPFAQSEIGKDGLLEIPLRFAVTRKNVSTPVEPLYSLEARVVTS
jgi:hypothetical protein